jgi:NADP-dependent 3-hydroxy acid dehydrogenase YdfG
MPPPFGPLANRIAIVTGASAGIGEAIVREFVALHAQVVLNARRRERLEAMVQEFGTEDASFVAGDCADDDTIQRMFEVARADFGGGSRDADLIVINAGRGLKGSVTDSDMAEWEEMVRTNYIGAAKMLRAAATFLCRASEGKSGPGVLASPRDIVVIGSNVGRNLSPFSGMYGSTKFAVHSLAEGARRELGPKGIRVTLIEPGFVKSEFQDVAGYDPKWVDGVFEKIGPVLTPADVAKTIAFAVSQPANVHLNEIMIRPTRQDYP